MNGSLDRLDLSSKVEGLDALPEIPDGRMGDVIGSEDGMSLSDLVERVDVLDGENGENDVVSGVSEGYSGSGSEREVGDVFWRDVECDGHGEELSSCESVGSEDAARNERTRGKRVRLNLEFVAPSRYS